LFSLARHWEWQALWPWPLTARLLGRTIRSWCRLKFRSRRLPDAWDGITPQLSDFHYDDRFSVVPLRKASDVVNPLCPDLLVVTGDFVQFLSSRNIYITRKSIRPQSSLPLSWPN